MNEPQGETVRFQLTLQALPASVAVARHAVLGLPGWVGADRIERLELITSEIVTNAIRHGSPHEGDVVEFEVLATAATVSAYIRDRGPSFELPTAAPSTPQTGGYGLHIVTELASQIVIRRTGVGNEVHVTV